MRSKMLVNAKFAIPSALLVLIALFIAGGDVPWRVIEDFSLIKTLPYFVVLTLALLGMHIIAVLMIGIIMSGLIGFFFGASSGSFRFFSL